MKKSKVLILACSLAMASTAAHAKKDWVVDIQHTSVNQEISSGTRAKVDVDSTGIALQTREFDTFYSSNGLNLGLALGVNTGAEFGTHFQFAFMPSYHVSNDANLYAKVGLGVTDAPSSDGLSESYGVGAHYFFSKSFGVAAEYGVIYTDRLYRTTALNIGLTYRK